MAFSADELRVLRRALAENLRSQLPSHVLPPTQRTGAHVLPRDPVREAERLEDVQETARLAESIEEAVREGGRLRAFLLAELVRYRAALPGSAPGYLERLEEAVHDGYVPDAEDLTALRRLAALPCGPEERERRNRLRSLCQSNAEPGVRRPLQGRDRPDRPDRPVVRAVVSKSRPHRGLELLIGGAAGGVPAAAPLGGTHPMNPRDAADRAEDSGESPAQATPPADAPRTTPRTPARTAPGSAASAGSGSAGDPARRPAPGSAADGADKQRRRGVPTPGDLFPGGVRPGAHLPTGTG